MRRNNTQSLAEVLRDYISEMKMDRKLKEVNVVQSWEAVEKPFRGIPAIFISRKAFYLSK